MITFLPLAVNDQSVQPAPLPWWFWIVLSLALVAMVWWLWKQGYLACESHPQPEVEAHRTPVLAAAPAADDLKIIEGIGPRINTLLQQAGICTFAQLAEARPDHIRQILQQAGLRLAAPETWPQQAALARDGKLEQLKALQESLTAGRK